MIICIGNALVDSLEQIEEFVIDELNLNKARMTLVDKERSNFLLQNMKNPIYEAGVLQPIQRIGSHNWAAMLDLLEKSQMMI